MGHYDGGEGRLYSREADPPTGVLFFRPRRPERAAEAGPRAKDRRWTAPASLGVARDPGAGEPGENQAPGGLCAESRVRHRQPDGAAASGRSDLRKGRSARRSA